MKTYIIAIALIVAAVSFSACNSGNKNQKSKDEHVDDHDDHDHSGETLEKGEKVIDEIHFSTQQAQAVGLQSEEIRPAPFNYVIKTSGQILSAQGDEVVVAATSNGIVSFANSSISDGVSIRAGETIVTISAKNLLDGDPAAKAKIAYETAEREFQRAEKLIKDQIISAKEYEQSRLNYQTAKTIYEAQSANTTTGGVRVTSPIGGYLKNRLVGQGEYVSVGQPIAVVSQNRRLQLRAEVSENYFKNMRNIGDANFQTSYDNVVYQLSALNGRLLSFGRASGAQSFYIPITFEFDNIGDIVPGSFATVYLLSKEQENALSVPVSAVTEEQGLHFVYIQIEKEGYRRQEVTTGQSNGDRIQILSGLKPGDKVVTHGVYQVKLAAVSSAMPEGHSH